MRIKEANQHLMYFYNNYNEESRLEQKYGVVELTYN